MARNHGMATWGASFDEQRLIGEIMERPVAALGMLKCPRRWLFWAAFGLLRLSAPFASPLFAIIPSCIQNVAVKGDDGRIPSGQVNLITSCELVQARSGV